MKLLSTAFPHPALEVCPRCGCGFTSRRDCVRWRTPAHASARGGELDFPMRENVARARVALVDGLTALQKLEEECGVAEQQSSDALASAVSAALILVFAPALVAPLGLSVFLAHVVGSMITGLARSLRLRRWRSRARVTQEIARSVQDAVRGTTEVAANVTEVDRNASKTTCRHRSSPRRKRLPKKVLSQRTKSKDSWLPCGLPDR
jgi:hypothetical protein